MIYSEDEMLMLSGIQHFIFCKRQWALIHIEQQWSDNRLTTEGNILHKNVDNPSYRQKNGSTITLRSVHLASKRLGLYGVADAVELVESLDDDNYISHPIYKGHWLPIPIEYKRGHSKISQCDRVQLAAQAIALEEMYNLTIDHGAIFYGETRHREIVPIDQYLRDLAKNSADEMHVIFKTKKLPKAEEKPCCRNCSLLEVCLPQLHKRRDVKKYLKQELYEETP